MKIDKVLVAAGAGLLAVGLPMTSTPLAGATFPHTTNGDVVFASSYATPTLAAKLTTCAPPLGTGTTACRNFTAAHLGGSQNLWLVNPQGLTTANSGQGMANAPIIDPTKSFQLTDTTGTDSNPAYPQDGSKVVFSRDTTQFTEIWEVPAANAPAAEDSSTTPTPGVAAADGATELTNDQGAGNTFPSFAQDNHTVVFVQGGTDLVTINDSAPAPPPETVLNFPGVGTLGGSGAANASHPVFDPGDSTRIALTNGNDIELLTGVPGPGIQAFDVSSLITAFLAGQGYGAGTDANPNWLPSSGAGAGTIVFDSSRMLPGFTTKPRQLWGVSLSFAGGGVTVTGASPVFENTAVSPPTPAQSGFTDIQPVASPDGTTLGFTRTLSNKDIESESVLLPGTGWNLPVSGTPVELTAAPTNPTDWEADWTGNGGGSPVLPEAPYAVLLPAGGLLVAGLALGLRRRRSTIA
jgi:hypothetical protein